MASGAPSSPPPAAPSVDVADGAAASPAHPGHADRDFASSGVGGFHLAAVVERRLQRVVLAARVSRATGLCRAPRSCCFSMRVLLVLTYLGKVPGLVAPVAQNVRARGPNVPKLLAT